MQRVELSVIIPAWNEEKRLPKTLGQCIDYLAKQPYSSEILVVSDGSKDKTVEVASSFRPIYPNLRVISFPFNKGKGFGVKEGMLAAKGKFRLFMDADNAVPITCVDEFLTLARNGKDIIIGSRAHAQSEIRAAQGFPRKQLGVLFGYLQYLVLRLPFKDTQCGFKLLTAEAADEFFPHITYDCAYFDAELLYIAHHMKANIAQLPVVWSHDDETRLPIGMRRTFDLLRKLSTIKSRHAKTIKQLKQNRAERTIADGAPAEAVVNKNILR